MVFGSQQTATLLEYEDSTQTETINYPVIALTKFRLSKLSTLLTDMVRAELVTQQSDGLFAHSH